MHQLIAIVQVLPYKSIICHSYVFFLGMLK